MIGIDIMKASGKAGWVAAVIVANMFMVAGCELPGAEPPVPPATPPPGFRRPPPRPQHGGRGASRGSTRADSHAA